MIMGPAQAIETCIKKSFKFSGKASRPEYWWFLPIGVLLPIAALAALQWLYPSLSSLLLGVVFLIALLPLMSVTKRRLTDSGENGVWFETPLVALVLFLAAIWAITGLNEYVSSAFDAGAEGAIGLGVAIIWWLGLAILVPVALHQFLIGFIYGTALFLQMTVPSKSENKSSGPNPNEVSP